MTADHTANIMSAVLLSASQISSFQEVIESGPLFLRDMLIQDYFNAVKSLEEAKIGYVWVSTTQHSRIFNISYSRSLFLVSDKSRVFFVKKPPDQVKDILLKKKFIHLCTIEEYDERYQLPIPHNAYPGEKVLKKMDVERFKKYDDELTSADCI